MSSPELLRIKADMTRCKQRIAEITAGTRGVRTGAWSTTESGIPGAGLAYSNQLRAQESALAKLELEFVNAMVPIWGPTAVIEKMQAPLPAPRPPSDADVRAAVLKFLANVPDEAPVKSLKELLQQ